MTDQEICGACDGSRRMPRDPDIGTDQECFVCDGSGVIAAHEAKAAPAVPQGEPIAWTVAGEVTNWSRDFSMYRTQHYVRPVYATPAAPSQEPAVPRCEPVAVIGSGWTFLWASGDAIEDIVKRHGLKIGSKLYATPSAASQPVPFDQWNSSPYTQVLHETIKDLSQKLASMTQSQPVTLTDDEIRRNWSGGACPPWGIKFARAIIAALREKEGKR